MYLFIYLFMYVYIYTYWETHFLHLYIGREIFLPVRIPGKNLNPKPQQPITQFRV